MRCLVTGNLGYIGLILTHDLLKDGHEVIGYDCGYFPNKCFGRKDAFESSKKIKQIKKDIRDITNKDMNDIDVVFHLAALPNDPSCDIDPKASFDINHLGTLKVATAAKAAGVGKFVFASSCSVFGAKANQPITEEDKPEPVTPYAISKLRAEKDLLKLNSKTFAVTCMRNATCYGVSPRMRFDMVLNSMVGYAYTEGKVKILSDGSAWRPLIHIEDVSEAYRRTMNAPIEDVSGEIFSIGTENFEVNQIAKIAADIVKGSTVYYEKNGKKDPRSYNVVFNKFQSTVGFKSKWDAKKGAYELLAAYKQYGLTKENFQDDMFWAGKYFKYLIGHKKVDNNIRLI